MSRFTVMGFTEAELGFFLAGLLAAVAGGAALEAKGSTEVWRDSVTVVVSRSDSLTRRIEQLVRNVDSLSQSLDSTRKRSNLTPLCSEKGETRQVVATVFVKPGPIITIDGFDMAPTRIAEHLRAHVVRADSLGCRYSVVLVSDPGVSGPQFQQAQRAIRPSFNTI